MSISQLRSVLTDRQWLRLTYNLVQSHKYLSVIRGMSGKEAEEIREL